MIEKEYKLCQKSPESINFNQMYKPNQSSFYQTIRKLKFQVVQVLDKSTAIKAQRINICSLNVENFNC